MTHPNRLRALVRTLIEEGMDPVDAAMEATRMLQGGGGDESPEAAYDKYMASELADPVGAYSEGGLTAGGIFGTGAIDFTDHDSSARQRGVAVRTQMLGARAAQEQTELLKLKLQMAEQAKLLAENQAKLAQLTGGREDDPWNDDRGARRRRRHR